MTYQIERTIVIGEILSITLFQLARLIVVVESSLIHNPLINIGFRIQECE